MTLRLRKPGAVRKSTGVLVTLLFAFVFSSLAFSSLSAQEKTAWVKVCEDVELEGRDRNVCITHHERLDGNTGAVLVSAAIRQIRGEPNATFMVMVPLGMALLPGAQVKIGDEDDVIRMPFVFCHPSGCTGQVEAEPDLLARLGTHDRMMVAVINALGKPIGFPVPLTGFQDALLGEPVDTDDYSKARQRLLLTIRQRQIERARQQASDN